jgi:hypothetical protein
MALSSSILAHVADLSLARIASRTSRTTAGRRVPNARRVLVAGLAAAAVFLGLLQLLAVTVYDEPFWKFFRMVAAMVRGPAALESEDEFDAAVILVGASLYVALSLLFALALAFISGEVPRRFAALAGLSCGVGLFYLNFYGFTTLFPWFASHRTIDMLLAHALFGVMVVKLSSRR